MECVLGYNCEIWRKKTEIKRKILTVEIDYLRRTEGIQKTEKFERRNFAGECK